MSAAVTVDRSVLAVVGADMSAPTAAPELTRTSLPRATRQSAEPGHTERSDRLQPVSLVEVPEREIQSLGASVSQEPAMNQISATHACTYEQEELNHLQDGLAATMQQRWDWLREAMDAAASPVRRRAQRGEVTLDANLQIWWSPQMERNL